MAAPKTTADGGLQVTPPPSGDQDPNAPPIGGEPAPPLVLEPSPAPAPYQPGSIQGDTPAAAAPAPTIQETAPTSTIPTADEVDKSHPYFLDETGRRGRVITLVIPGDTGTSTHEEVLPHGSPDVPDVTIAKGEAGYMKDAASAKTRLKTRWIAQ